MTIITGRAAIKYAARGGLALCKYSDPVEGPRNDLDIAEARAVADEDPALIWINTGRDSATVEDAIDMLLAGGVDLAGELDNINHALGDITEELEREGYVGVDFDAADLAAALREAIAEGRDG